MIIVNDIQDATMMKNKLSSLVRRSANSGKSAREILVELMFLVQDLDDNIERIDREMSTHAGETV